MDVDELIQQAQQGERQAKEQLARIYRGFIISRARRLADRQWPVEDLAQEAYWGLERAIRTFRPGQSAFTGWVRFCVDSVMMDAKRKRRNLIHVPHEAIRDGREMATVRQWPMTSHGDPVDLQDPHDDGFEAQQRDAVRYHLGDVPERTKQVFVLRFVDGLGPQEIGEQLGLSPSAISWHCGRGINQVREQHGLKPVSVSEAMARKQDRRRRAGR